MTDEMAVFVEDLREKKALAQSSKHKVKKARKNTAFAQPSEHYQILRKKNGAVMTYKIGQKISWKEFRRYPQDMQKEYFTYFAEKFGASTGMLAEMLGTSQSAMQSYIKKHAPELRGIMVRRPEEMNRERFAEWLAEQDGSETVPGEKPVSVPKEKPVEQPYFVNTFQSGQLSLVGTSSEIFQTLFGVFRDARLSVSVKFRVLPPEVMEQEEPMEVQDESSMA